MQYSPNRLPKDSGAQCFVIIKHTVSFVDFKDRILLVTAELKMDVLREREVKDSLERQLQDEQKVRGECPIL